MLLLIIICTGIKRGEVFSLKEIHVVTCYDHHQSRKSGDFDSKVTKGKKTNKSIEGTETSIKQKKRQQVLMKRFEENKNHTKKKVLLFE